MLGWLRALVLVSVVGLWSGLVLAQSPAPAEDPSLAVMRTFTEQANTTAEEVRATERERHQILFIMGVLLLISLLTTAGLGLSMVLAGKQVFVAHLLGAGVTVFLSLAHAVTAIVWFYPF